MVIGHIDGMEMYYRRFSGKGAPLEGYFVTIRRVGIYRIIIINYTLYIIQEEADWLPESSH